MIDDLKTAASSHLAMHSYTTHSADETVQLGRQLAAGLRPGTLVLLRGDLGAGKTTMIKGIAEGFHAAAAEDVTSPTFTLIHEYRSSEVTLYHIDLYRIDTQRELDTLALDDLRDPKSILLIEWGEKFKRFTREKDVEIVIEHLGGDERRIKFSVQEDLQHSRTQRQSKSRPSTQRNRVNRGLKEDDEKR